MHEGASADPRSERPCLALVVSFLDEAAYLPRLLASLDAQTEPPEQLLLVDDGSSDASTRIAEEFAREHAAYARSLRRPPRPADRDRLVSAPELRAFMWAVEQLQPDWQVVAKLDGDLELPPTLLADVRDAFAVDPSLGITGSYLSTIGEYGQPSRERTPVYHVRGPNKFYRRECFEQIMPLPTILGWDTIDDLRARRLGWITRSFRPRSGDALHLRPTGAHGGRLRASRRWGRCAWGYGAHPLWVLLVALRRTAARPYGLMGLGYLWGWIVAALRRYPRAEPELLKYSRREDLARIARLLRRPRPLFGGEWAPADAVQER